MDRGAGESGGAQNLRGDADAPADVTGRETSTAVGRDSGGGERADATADGPCTGTFVFCDDYTDSSLASAYTAYHGAWTRGVGQYAVIDATAWQRARSVLAPDVSSFDVTIRGRTEGDYGLGLVYGASASADDGYAVLVHPDQFQGVYLKHLIPGEADKTIASTPLAAGLGGTPLTLRVVREGTTVTVWLNSKQVLQSSDLASGLQGRLGLLLSDTDVTVTDAGAVPGASFTLLRVDSEAGLNTTKDGGVDARAEDARAEDARAVDARAVDGKAPDAGNADTGTPPCTGAACNALSYMVGYGGGSTSDSAIAQAETLFGRSLDMTSNGVTVDGYVGGPYHSSNGKTVGQVVVFEMLSMPWDTNQGLVDLAAAASGAYDDVYTKMAQQLANSGTPIVSARPGHEMNGNWYPWSAVAGNTHNATPANYIATFRRIAQIIRKYNPDTLIEFCAAEQPIPAPFPGSTSTPLDYWVQAYDPVTNPGGADIVSMDFYEGQEGADFENGVVGGLYGIGWLATFAQENAVKMAFSEVATGLSGSPGQGGGCPCSNDGPYLQKLINWLNALPNDLLRFFVFSPWEPADDLLSTGNSAIQQVWHTNWANTHFDGSWWHGAQVPSQ